MTRLRVILGLVAGVFLVLSSAAHSLLGWKQVHAELIAATTPSDLINGLALGWHFAGGAMLAFGLIVVTISIQRLRGATATSSTATTSASSTILAIIAALYLGFGAMALIAVGFDPFFVVVFIVPGLLLVAAAPR